MASVDRVLEILCDAERRRVLHMIDGHKDLTQTDVADQCDSQTRIELVHIHLPKLDEAGCIEWDRDGEEISKGPHYEEVKACLDLLESHADELPVVFTDL